MDRMIFTAMTGAKHLLERQAVTANNLANASSTGYRAETRAGRAVPVVSETLPTRAFALESTTGADFTPGAISRTGRTLDVAVQGKGWIAVEAPGGGEAYTRDGSLQVNQNGVLQTRNGLNVLGDAGPITIPEQTEITIGSDGTVSTVPAGSLRASVSALGRIRLVNPDEAVLERGADGLFRVRGGGDATPDAAVRLASGYLEASNVNVAETMVDMIALARQFDLQMKLMHDAESNARQASQLLAPVR
ncbi:MAG: flagellar basal body rod protein FlgF [Burkholderiales bacterium]|nr:flagellar basal body rod protein FlgF [Burkholderiales bacterium]